MLVMLMIKSSKPRIQRKFRFTAPLHQKQRFMHAHVDKALRAKLGVKRSSIRIAKGDTVKVMSGASRGKTGKVTRVDLKSGKVYIDSIAKKNARGKEYNIPISPSNVYLIDLDASYKGRIERLQPNEAAKKEKM